MGGTTFAVKAQEPTGSLVKPGTSTRLAPWWSLLLAALGIAVALALFVPIIIWGPAHLVQQGKASDDAYLKAITDTRTALVQAVGGFAVLLGVVVGVFTLRHNRQLLRATREEHLESLDASAQALQQTLSFNRESLARTAALTESGLITERFSKGIEQLGRSGKDAVDLRLGGIYALEQIARESAIWHNPVIEVLAAFVRVHASGKPDPDGPTVAEQVKNIWAMPKGDRWQVIPVDLAAALGVLARRDRSKDAQKLLDLIRADFRRTEFPVGLNLHGTNFEDARMQFGRFAYANLRECFFLATDLRGAFLRHADLRGASFFQAKLMGADFEQSRLDGAEIEASDLTATNLTMDQLKVAKIDKKTKLPDHINREALKQSAAAEPPTPSS